MKKLKITKRVAKICDYTLWAIAVIMAFWLDWKAGVALLAFDAMRAFEDIQKGIAFSEWMAGKKKDDAKEAPK